MSGDDDTIPSVGKYRDVSLHDGQGAKRLRTVKRQIDLVLDTLHDVDALADFCAHVRNAPESRLCACAKCEALCEQAFRERRSVNVDLRQLRASVAGLDSVRWRSPWRFCSLLEDHMPNAVRREVPLGDDPLWD